MKKSNWLKSIFCVFLTAIVITGCGSSYVDNKKDNPLETTSGQANSDEDEITDTQDNTDESETTDTQDNTDESETTETEELKSFSMSAGLSVYCLDEDNWVDTSYNQANIKENINEFVVQLDCTPDKSLKWSNIPVRLYVIDNGNMIPFILENGDGKLKLFHDIEYEVNKQQNVQISIDQSQLSAKNGKLCVIAIYNPSVLPGKGISIFRATAGECFDYVNSGYNGENTVSLADAKGEYISVPEDENRTDMEEIGPDDIYLIGRLHFYEDVKVNNLSELYMYVNSGRKCSEKQIVGIICDGELLQFEDGSYFKWFDSETGTHTLRYNMQEFKNIEPGLHYFQVIRMSLEPKDYESFSNDISISNRYRVDIGGNN